MKVLVIGKGGREHAIAWQIKKKDKFSQVFVAPGNVGMSDIATIVPIDENEIKKLINFVQDKKIDLTIIGSENVLAQGIVDDFRQENLIIFGPTKQASLIETSKSYAKNLMVKYNIPTANYQIFTDYQQAKKYIANNNYPLVVKYGGLAAGKGVIVAGSFVEADYALQDIFLTDKYKIKEVVIEEFLSGNEFSLMALVNHDKVYPLEVAQDYKKAFDHDLGSNTGGMGAYSPVPMIKNNVLRQAKSILQQTANALVKENNSFSGVLYGGFIQTKTNNHEAKVIEFNARFGDPETEVILPRLETNLAHIMLDILNQKEPVIQWNNQAIVGVVMASKGYPKQYETGDLITNLNLVKNVFHMGVAKTDKGLVTNGGRVLFVWNQAKSLEEARKQVYDNLNKIDCKNLFYRKDIANIL